MANNTPSNNSTINDLGKDIFDQIYNTVQDSTELNAQDMTFDQIKAAVLASDNNLCVTVNVLSNAQMAWLDRQPNVVGIDACGVYDHLHVEHKTFQQIKQVLAKTFDPVMVHAWTLSTEQVVWLENHDLVAGVEAIEVVEGPLTYKNPHAPRCAPRISA